MSCSRDQVVDAERLLGEAERRWQALLTEHPDLGPAVDLQRRLVSRSLELGVTIDTRPPRGVGVAPGVAVVKLRRKQPVLAGEVLEIDATVLKPFVPGFCEDFALGGAGAPAERLHGTLEHGEIDVWSLLAASLARHQDAIRAKAHHVRVAPDLLWLVAELGIGPLATSGPARVPDRDLGGTPGTRVRARRMAGGLLSGVWVVASIRGDGRAHPIAALLVLRQRLVPRGLSVHLLRRSG